MKQYYYTVSALPVIRFEESPPVTEDDFFELCASFVAEEDLATIRGARIWLSSETLVNTGRESTSSVVLKRVNAFLRQIQLSLARFRAHELNRDAESLPKASEVDPLLEDEVRQITSEESPLKAELAILKRTWDLVEELRVGHFFDRETLIAYYLQLQLATRRAAITDFEAGRAEFNRQYAIAAQKISEIGNE